MSGLQAPGHEAELAGGDTGELAELCGRAVVDASEMWTMVKGSVRHRTLML